MTSRRRSQVLIRMRVSNISTHERLHGQRYTHSTIVHQCLKALIPYHPSVLNYPVLPYSRTVPNLTSNVCSHSYRNCSSSSFSCYVLTCWRHEGEGGSVDCQHYLEPVQTLSYFNSCWNGCSATGCYLQVRHCLVLY